MYFSIYYALLYYITFEFDQNQLLIYNQLHSSLNIEIDYDYDKLLLKKTTRLTC